jgi:hypothetical protein
MSLFWVGSPHGDAGSEHLWNVGRLLPAYTVQGARRYPSLYSAPWELQIWRESR